MKNELEKIEQSVPAVATPMDLLQMATAQGADIGKLEKLMELQERWEANEARKAFAQAKADFAVRVPHIDKTRKAHNSNYAGLAETLGQIKELMHDCGFSHGWATTQDGNLISVTCTLTHVMGHSEQSSMTAEPDTSGSKNSIQAIASTVTYLERYTLFAVLGLASKDQDTDGNFNDPISEEDAAALEKLADEVGADKMKLCKHFNVASIKDIPARKHYNVVKMLEKKGAQK